MVEVKVFKSKKRLHILEKGKLVHEFAIGIGKNETGHKQTRDDLRTPEGEYRVCVKNDKSKYFLSLGLNYPNINDANIALENDRISEAQYQSIVKAQEKHGGSDWSTAIGGEIYIHGGLEDKAWSEGCIRMYNEDIKTIFKKISVGTPVQISS